MIKDIKGLITALKPQAIKADLELLTEGIMVPEATEDLSTFSIQGGLKLTLSAKKSISSIIIQFLGSYQNLKQQNKQCEKGSTLIENQLELMENTLDFKQGTSVLEFELALPRSLPSTISSDAIKINYTISAVINVEGEASPLICQLPVRVTNNYLVPYLNDLLDTYSHTGNIQSKINYSLNFTKRVFNMGESVNFNVDLDTTQDIKVNSLTVSLLQRETITNFEEPNNTTNVINSTLNRDIRILCTTNCSTHPNQFIIPLKQKLNKRTLVPSINTKEFEVSHQIQLLINYSVQGQTPQIRFVKVPIAIQSCDSDAFSLSALPKYSQFDLNSVLIPIGELPPVYCN
ncbi:hypothetical protein CONCODRAFT_158424 [Conidiobolus coronatus NRRL 28638]|uniref:Arrestin C-terminal-like domain-containing protein n=1 Tax=Conidiobolus coronatus (strain ATCC 28846 / CBS 209.66 / NRRL 28638) TaxID=796925 RepID=A0A137PHC7_CONC2|nr:hypothetical protein CONCODRAFT_158424 [Conidiobolus coronatus NRRL 28638]|eukprot:KXN74331.1 hypothetical protein CONCODRAFT_158424 [Conidiobolus coronatus NRRL 28638]